MTPTSYDVPITVDSGSITIELWLVASSAITHQWSFVTDKKQILTVNHDQSWQLICSMKHRLSHGKISVSNNMSCIRLYESNCSERNCTEGMSHKKKGFIGTILLYNFVVNLGKLKAGYT